MLKVLPLPASCSVVVSPGVKVRFLRGRGNSGIRIIFPTRGTSPKDQAEWHEVVITWPEIENLVTRVRTTGKSRHLGSVKYFTED